LTISQNISKSQFLQNIPNTNATPQILIISDGYETLNVGQAAPYAEMLQDNGINIVSVAVGNNTYYTNFMEQIASPDSYFNLEKYLNTNDGDINSFAQRLASYFTSVLVYPTWYKAIRDTNGNWSPTTEISDMVIQPGDYLTYIHQANVAFTGPNSTSFSTPSIAFAFNAKLDGWDYVSSTFSSQWVGSSFGGKPFWGLSNVAPDSNLDNKFYKGDMSYGGQITFADGYVPIHQPPISNIVLNNGDFIQYNRRGMGTLVWNQTIDIGVVYSGYQWNQIIFYEGVSNLQDLLRVGNVSDLIAYSSNEPSNIVLQGYTEFNPCRYNYYANNAFNYTEKLYYTNRCTGYSVTTGLALQTLQPFANLDNVHFPTVASVSIPSLAFSGKEYGEYLLPENLGVSYYRGRGYTIAVSTDTLTFINSISAESLFLDTGKYGPRNRGLTQKDQNSPVEITNIDNTWMYQSYSNSSAAGMIVDTLNNQKFTPYQSKYEITQKNDLGLCRQDDDFQFWNPDFPAVWAGNQSKYPLTFRQELLSSSYQNIQQELLVGVGVMADWKVDIFGNNYGLFKVNGATATIPNVYSTIIGSVTGSAYGCSTSVTTDQIVFGTPSQQTFQFNPPVLLANPRQS
jgi:hypothetical protein